MLLYMPFVYVCTRQERRAKQREEFLENHPSDDDSDGGNER